MNYNRKTSERKAIVLVAVLFFNLILISRNVMFDDNRSLFSNIVSFIVTPFQLGYQNSVNFVSTQLNHYVFVKNTYRKYSALKKDYSRLKYENYILRRKIAKLGFVHEAARKPGVFSEAEVIAVNHNMPFGSIMINKGSVDGIKPDMVVLNREGDLVGKIMGQVAMMTSRVKLITSSSGGVGVNVESNMLEGLLTGNNRKICKLEYVIESEEVSIGDKVLTSGTDGLYPAGLPVGRVVDIKKDYLLQSISIKPHWVEKPLKYLLIVKNE